ncbi:MAG TPA: amino acid permease [Bryobacteraceae bacterium]|jgi:amino acid transporter|nr:amino acid permease [Bryobacteraceae bacterium]
MSSPANTTGARMKESNRDVGLRRTVGTWGLTASLVNVVIGAGIFAVPAALAGSIGPYAPLAFLICAIAIGSVAICWAEGGSRMPTSGGAYGYIQAAFGPLTGYVAGTMLWFSDVLACGGVAAALGDVTVSVLPAPWQGIARAAVIVGIIGFMALVHIAGVSQGERLINALTAAKLIPIVIFIIAGAGAIHGANFAAAVHPSTAGLGRAVILALFALTGMEVPLSASGEIARPSSTIPRALAIAMVSVTLVYIAIQVVAQGILGPALGHSTVPLADAMARISPTLRVVMLLGAGLSMLGWLSSDFLGSPRVLFAFARDGFLPGVLGRVHPERHTPHVAIGCYAALAIGFALTGTFAELAVLSTLAVTVVYMLGCAAAWWLARGGVALAGQPLNFRWLRAAVVTGITGMFILMVLASRAEIVGLLTVIAISAAGYVLTARGRARRSA